MLTKWLRIGIGFLFLLVILGCVFPFINDNGQEARRSVNITINITQRQEFFNQLHEFAEKHNFTILIDTRPQGVEGFYIDMYRDDIMIAGTNPFVPAEYQLGFYDADRQNPVSETVLEDLISDLESFISEVPSATFTVEKQ